MIRSLYIASSGMQSQQLNLDVISNNLSNVNTTGFKKSRADFQSLLYQSLKEPTVSSENGNNSFGIEVGNGVRVVGTRTILEQGVLHESESNQDLAIDGRGYFMVQLPDGNVGFTRNGAFRINSEGVLVNSNGCRVLSSQGNVTPENSISLNSKELKYIKPDTDTGTVNIDKEGIISTEKEISNSPVLELADFINPGGLKAVGSTTYVASDVCGDVTIAQPTCDDFGTIEAGFLESSNVQIVEEMVKMIMAQRAYEIGSKAVQTSDEMMGMTNSLKR
ncbi:MAG: flagellar basal-body rod protein FlgG [Clostridia bacterium]|nr:flagellar basal-body rod protein FlgG [Clostridia bacterium]